MPYYPGYAQDPGILAMFRMGITDPTMLAPGMQPAPNLGGLPPGMQPAAPGGIPVGPEPSFANASTKAGVPLTPDPSGTGYDLPTFAPPSAPGGVPAPAQGGPSGGRSVTPAPGSSPSPGALPYAPQAPQTPSVPMAPRPAAGAATPTANGIPVAPGQPAQPSSSSTPPARSSQDMAKSFDLFGTNTPGSSGTMPQDVSTGGLGPRVPLATHRPPTGPVVPGTPEPAAAAGTDAADQGLLGKLSPMSNRLMEMGMGLMSGNRNEQMANALKGFHQGAEDDRAALQERRQALSDKQMTQAATAYAAMATKAGYPDVAKAILASPMHSGDIFNRMVAQEGIDAGKFTMTDTQKDYRAYLTGLKPGEKALSFGDFLFQSKRMGSGGAEDTFSSEMGKDTAGRMKAVIEGGNNARNTIDNLNLLSNQLERTQQGLLSGYYKTAGELAASLGVSQDTLSKWGFNKDAGAAEVSTALIKQFSYANHLGADKGGLPVNNFSEEDRKAVDAMGPSLQNTPEGNRILIKKQIIDEQIKVDRANSWDAYAKQNGGATQQNYRDWETQYSQQMKKNNYYAPLYGEVDQYKRSHADTAEAKPPPAGGTPGGTAKPAAAGPRTIRVDDKGNLIP